MKRLLYDSEQVRQAARKLDPRIFTNGGQPVNNCMDKKIYIKRKTELLSNFGSYCQICRGSFDANELTIDHIVPRSRGGGNVYDNLQLACRPCNGGKSSLLPHELEELSGLLN